MIKVKATNKVLKKNWFSEILNSLVVNWAHLTSPTTGMRPLAA